MQVFNIENFRGAFPEFVDESKYTDEMLTFWATAAESLLNSARWGDLLTHGLYLYTAHNITLAYADRVAGEKNRNPGSGVGGVMTNKSVGDVSVGYDTHAITLEGAGNYNSTKYGREFWQLMLIVGMGGQQLT